MLKIIPDIFTSKYYLDVLKHDTRCNIFCWEQAHYTYITEKRHAVVSLHDMGDMEKYSPTQYSMEVGGELYTPGTLPLRSTPTMNGRRGWVSPRTSLGILGNRKIF